MSRLALHGGDPVRSIDFPSWPQHDEREYNALKNALDSGNWWRKSGSYVSKFEHQFASFHGARYGLAVANGTDALEIALMAHGIKPGDKVIVPAFTFISTSLAVQRVGGIPIPVDIDKENMCISVEAIKKSLDNKTRFIIPVHMAGHLCDCEKISEIANQHNLIVIHDAAHAHGAEGYGKKLGDWKETLCFSFQNFKLMSAGEGGVILFEDEKIYEQAFLYHNCGRSKDDIIYEHEVPGMNSRMNEFSAAILVQQLKKLSEQTSRRDKNAKVLYEKINDVNGINMQSIEDWVDVNPYYMLMCVIDKEHVHRNNRDTVVKALNAEGIPAFVNYRSIYNTKAFWHGRSDDKDRGYWQELCPNTEDLAKYGFWIHHRVLLGDESDVIDVIKALSKVLNAQLLI